MQINLFTKFSYNDISSIIICDILHWAEDVSSIRKLSSVWLKQGTHSTGRILPFMDIVVAGPPSEQWPPHIMSKYLQSSEIVKSYGQAASLMQSQQDFFEVFSRK